MGEEQQQILRNKLWEIANTMRGNMNAGDFMYFTLGFIFYKFLSEKIELYINQELKEDGLNFCELWNGDNEEFKSEMKDSCIKSLGYFVEPEYLFQTVLRKFDEKENILPILEKSLKHIEDSTFAQDSQDDFNGLFSDIDLNSPKLGKTADDKNKLVGGVLKSLNGIDFQLGDSEIDVLGDAYEYMIANFAADAGKKAGEFYTPQEVSIILSRIATLGKQRIRSVYDPTCGSGSLVLRAAKDANAEFIFGQEKNPTTYNLCRMNMILHNRKYDTFDIQNGDTLENDLFGEQQFEAIVANPPFSANWTADSSFNDDDRFSKPGVLAPKSKADYAFIMHMVHHLSDDGTMTCVAPHGVLFRGASEGKTRRHLIENQNYLDAVIGLPANLFFGTSIPTCILVFKKCRQADNDILFIDASKEFEKVKTQNKLRPEHIEKIITTYQNRTEEAKYSHRASLQEVIDNEYNLNIPRYVDTFEEPEEIDIYAVQAEIKELESKRVDLDKQIEVYMRELGLVNEEGVGSGK